MPTSEAQALPSVSFGQSAPTFLLVDTEFQMFVKTATLSSRPQKKW